MGGGKKGRKSFKRTSKKAKGARRAVMGPALATAPQAPMQPTAPPPIDSGGDLGVAPDQQPNS